MSEILPPIRYTLVQEADIPRRPSPHLRGMTAQSPNLALLLHMADETGEIENSRANKETRGDERRGVLADGPGERDGQEVQDRVGPDPINE
jgi:hypothetical protein